jgi:predicted NAD/FAD-dependent oxidoreductase
MKTLIIGAGITGLSAARRLLEQGLTLEDIDIADKSRGIGGRMASRRLQTPTGTATFDHGAQFFTTRSEAFKNLLAVVEQAGVSRVWTRGFTANEDGHARWCGTTGMTDLCKWMAADAGLNIAFGTPVMNLGAHLKQRSYDAVIHTAPIPQALATLNGSGRLPPPELNRQLAEVHYHATLTVMLATTDHPTGLPPSGAAQYVDHPDLAFIADNHAKGISAIPAVTIHLAKARSEAMWSATDADVVGFALKAAKEQLGDAGKPNGVLASSVQRWRYADPITCWPDKYVMWGESPRIVLAGEAFDGPRVEGGFLSGRAAADALLRGSQQQGH